MCRGTVGYRLADMALGVVPPREGKDKLDHRGRRYRGGSGVPADKTFLDCFCSCYGSFGAINWPSLDLNQST
jgi:hypothetical protein